MKQRLLTIFAMLSLMISGAMAQSLTVADITAEAGQEATITVAVEGAAQMTALQFNLSLPEGFTLAGDISLGSAAQGHTLSTNALASGDLLIVLYDLYQSTFADGTLLTIPVVAAEDAVSGEARLYTVHTATAAAVSHTLSNVAFAMNIAPKEVAVSGIALDQTAATLTEGETLTLKATVSPDDATDKTVTWETSDAAIATVVDGVVTAVAPGEVTITAKAGDKEATCVVTVEKKVIAVSGIALDQTAATLTEGETLTLVATVSPDDATDKTVTWETSDAAIATVVDGVVTAVAPGEVIITAKAGDKEATCVVTVEKKVIAVSGITLDQTAATLTEGETLTLTATVSPDDATDKTVTWETSDAAIATVVDGVVTAVAPGEVTITAKAGDKEATCVVTVEKKVIAVSGITLDQTAATLTEGETLTLTATVSPDDATDKTVTWETSDAAIATVVDGVVTAVAPGTATITATAGDCTATCVVTVEKKVIAVSGIVLDQTAATLTEGETLTLTATVTPDDATDKTVTWGTSDAAIATVVDGVVTAVAPGEVIITAKAGEHSATCVVTVKAEAIVDLDMTHKVSRDWEGKSGNVTIDGIAMSEKYEGTADPVGDQLWQTVTGLENGKYTVKVWANARVAWVGSPATDGQEELTYIFANNVEKSIAVLHNPATNNNVLHTLEGVEVTDGTLRMGMTKKAAGSNWHSIQIESLTLHATNAVIANIAKVDLKAALDAANAVSPKTDEFAAAIAAAQDVYDNSKDAEEVKAAVATLKEATKLAILMNATEENPVLTDFVVNGTFDAGTTGWKSTTGAQNQGTATNQQGAFTGAFFENWNGSNYTGKLYQVIENVPNGIYELSICAFTNNHDATAQFVYANADKVALTTGAPTAYTVRTIVENNTIEVGFEQTAAVSNWCGIDNVSLTYLGEASNEAVVNAAKEAFTAAYEEFGAAFVACKAMMLKMSFYEVDDAAYQLNEQLATTTDVDALNAMTETLIEATAALNEINAVYAAYDVFVQRFKAAAEISEPLTTEAAELLEYNMYGGAGMQATSLEALEQAVLTIEEEYFTYMAGAKLLEGKMFDVTFKIVNPNFEKSLDGWTANKAGRIGGEGYDGIGGIAEIGEWGAAAWDASMSQSVTGLPNGKYVVKAAWMAANGIEMTFAANEGTTTVIGIGDQGGNIAKDGTVVEMGQGHRGWQYVEVEALVEDGTLTITVSSSSSAQYMWSNADAFELYYAGSPESTGVEQTIVNGQQTTVIYDLQGRKVTDTKGLKGIYIVNGKKKLF